MEVSSLPRGLLDQRQSLYANGEANNSFAMRSWHSHIRRCFRQLFVSQNSSSSSDSPRSHLHVGIHMRPCSLRHVFLPVRPDMIAHPTPSALLCICSWKSTGAHSGAACAHSAANALESIRRCMVLRNDECSTFFR